MEQESKEEDVPDPSQVDDTREYFADPIVKPDEDFDEGTEPLRTDPEGINDPEVMDVNFVGNKGKPAEKSSDTNLPCFEKFNHGRCAKPGCTYRHDQEAMETLARRKIEEALTNKCGIPREKIQSMFESLYRQPDKFKATPNRA